MLRLLLFSFAAIFLAAPLMGQGNTKDVYQRDTGPGFFKKLPNLNPKDVPSRELTGIVRDENGDPLESAIVTVTNVKTKAAKSFVTKEDGRYRFDLLIKADDYEVKAKFQGRDTETKTLSSFDPREKPTLNLLFEKEPEKKEKAAESPSKEKKSSR